MPFSFRFSRLSKRKIELPFEPRIGPYQAEIRWTSFGIPHIKAQDYESLSFGIGYCYTSLNAALLADSVLTVRGERSRIFGADAHPPGEAVTNLDSDLFAKFYFSPDQLDSSYRQHDPRSAAMMKAYARGASLYLGQSGFAALPHELAEVFKENPITERDLYLMLAHLAVRSSGRAFASAIVNAQPSNGDDSAPIFEAGTNDLLFSNASASLGSNAYALGADLTANGCGILVGNPHFPWEGPSRFFQMHLSIPDELDVMGASLPPFPIINIGFNRDVAWTHTVSSSRRFAIYELKLLPGQPSLYCLDGEVTSMKARTVTVSVKRSDGNLYDVQRTLYESHVGPIIMIPFMGCVWSDLRAYAFYDSARGQVGMIEQWLKINKAKSVRDIEAVLAEDRGTLWLTTVAADRRGDAFFGDFSAVPNISKSVLKRRAASRAAKRLSEIENIAVLDGSRSSSIPKRNEQSPLQNALLSSKKMPRIICRDYVLNSNDSHWLTNRKRKLSGYNRLVGRERSEQSFRTRMGFRELSALVSQKAGLITAVDLKGILFSNRNYAASLMLDEFLTLTREPLLSFEGITMDLGPAFEVLRSWDRRDNAESRGAVLFREFWRRIHTNSAIWGTSFDPRRPLETPRGLNTGDREVIAFLKGALAETMLALRRFNISLDASVGEVQRFPCRQETLAVHGGDGSAGVLNLIEFGSLSETGYDPSGIQGTSYTQAVTWEGGQVIAEAISPYSQTSDSESANYADQMKTFSQKGWIRLPFSEAEIERDPSLVVVILVDTLEPGKCI